jgi:hypothetical protein
LLYTIQLLFSAASKQIDRVPAASATINFPNPDALIDIAVSCYNSALEAGMNEHTEKAKIFSPQNWLKSKDSLFKLKASVQMYMNFITTMPEGTKMRQALELPTERFGVRWASDQPW